MTPGNSPRLGGQSEVTGREPELSGARKTHSRVIKAGVLGSRGTVQGALYLRNKKVATVRLVSFNDVEIIEDNE